jgi:hypothetical protein
VLPYHWRLPQPLEEAMEVHMAEHAHTIRVQVVLNALHLWWLDMLELVVELGLDCHQVVAIAGTAEPP